MRPNEPGSLIRRSTARATLQPPVLADEVIQQMRLAKPEVRRSGRIIARD